MDILLAMTLITMSQLSIVKAYVVPTGSMAPTILGFHKDVTCPECKARFSINTSSEIGPFAEKIIGCTCANCRRAIDFAKEKLRPQTVGGDRILVLATPTKLLRRDDLIVHRFPPVWFGQDRQDVRYITRLAGLPGETLAIHAGRLYVATDLKHQDEKVKPNDLWQREFMHPDDENAVKRFQQGKFAIIRKSPAMLLAQRRLVYDEDFPTAGLPQRWTAVAKSDWKRAEAHGFQHGGKKAEVDWLTYRHLLRSNRPGKTVPHLIMDDLAYNNFVTANAPFPAEPSWVGDLMIEFQVTITEAAGELLLDLARGSDRFQANFDLTSGSCTLYRLAKDAKPKELASVKQSALKDAGIHLIRFANCDDRLTLWIDDKLPFGNGAVFAPSAQNGPTAGDLEPIRIGSRGAAIRLQHLQVWRNIYYTRMGGRGDADGVDPADAKTWEPLRKLPVATFYVQPGHYFFLGDNSPFSSDSRDWGVVPEQLLAGRVTLRYFPFDRVGTIR